MSVVTSQKNPIKSVISVDKQVAVLARPNTGLLWDDCGVIRINLRVFDAVAGLSIDLVEADLFGI